MKQHPIAMAVAPHAAGLQAPDYPSVGAPGFMIYAARAVVLNPHQSARVQTGISLAIPEGLGALVVAEPSIAKNGIVATQEMFGADDRDEISILLTYGGSETFYTVIRGDVIARLVIMPILRVRLQQVAKLLSGPSVIPPSAFTEPD